MEMILDTNAISAVLDGDPAIEAVLANSERHHLPVIALGEYRFGLRSSRERTKPEPLIDALEGESTVLAIDRTTARHYADVRQGLKAAGTPIPENDIWIAALARQHRLPIATLDGHFDSVAGIRRVSW